MAAQGEAGKPGSRGVTEIFWGAADGGPQRTPEAVVRHALLSINAFEAGLVRSHKTGAPLSLMQLLAELGIEENLVYASPELARGESIDERSLVFTIGVLIFERLTERHPFGTPDNPERVARIRRCEMGSGVNFFPSVPKQLRTILMRSMGPFPEERYPGLQQLKHDLARFVGQPQLAAVQQPAPSSGARQPSSEARTRPPSAEARQVVYRQDGRPPSSEQRQPKFFDAPTVVSSPSFSATTSAAGGIHEVPTREVPPPASPPPVPGSALGSMPSRRLAAKLVSPELERRQRELTRPTTPESPSARRRELTGPTPPLPPPDEPDEADWAIAAAAAETPAPPIPAPASASAAPPQSPLSEEDLFEPIPELEAPAPVAPPSGAGSLIGLQPAPRLGLRARAARTDAGSGLKRWAPVIYGLLGAGIASLLFLIISFGRGGARAPQPPRPAPGGQPAATAAARPGQASEQTGPVPRPARPPAAAATVPAASKLQPALPVDPKPAPAAPPDQPPASKQKPPAGDEPPELAAGRLVGDAIRPCRVGEGGARPVRVAVRLKDGRVASAYANKKQGVSDAQLACLRRRLMGLKLEVSLGGAPFIEWSLRIFPDRCEAAVAAPPELKARVAMRAR